VSTSRETLSLYFINFPKNTLCNLLGIDVIISVFLTSQAFF
jgi:hypothetical protein